MNVAVQGTCNPNEARSFPNARLLSLQLAERVFHTLRGKYSPLARANWPTL